MLNFRREFATCWRPLALKTVGEVREISDDTLLSFQDCGNSSVALLRETLGLPSTDGGQIVGQKASLTIPPGDNSRAAA